MPIKVKVIFLDLGNTLVTPTRAWLPGAKDLLASLKSNGRRLGIISNTGNLTTRAEILELLPVDFDVNVFEPNLTLFSSEVNLEKPDKAIFQQAVARSALSAGECAYCSEDMVETLVAQHVGMLAIRVQFPPNNDRPVLEANLKKFESLT